MQGAPRILPWPRQKSAHMLLCRGNNVAFACSFFYVLPVPSVDGGRRLLDLPLRVDGRAPEPEGSQGYSVFVNFEYMALLSVLVLVHSCPNVWRSSHVLGSGRPRRRWSDT